MRQNNTPIRRKLMVMILLTSAAVLLLTSVALITYDFLSFRRRWFATLHAGASHCGQQHRRTRLPKPRRCPAIRREILNALRPSGTSSRPGLYDADGALFATYPAGVPARALPTSLKTMATTLSARALMGLQRCKRARNAGHAVLRSDLGALYDRLRSTADRRGRDGGFVFCRLSAGRDVPETDLATPSAARPIPLACL